METALAKMEINGSSIEVSVQGHGPSVVLLHGSAASSAQWRALIDRLSDGFRVIAPDFHGCGGSAPWAGDGPFWLSDEARIVHALMRDLDEPAHLVGHSFGGAVALQVARSRRQALCSLTLIEPVAFHLLRDGAEADSAALREIGAVAEGVTRALASGDYLGGMADFIDYWSGPGSAARLALAKRPRMAAGLGKVALDFHATLHDPRRLRDFKGIDVPTLLLQGSCTTRPAKRICERLAATLPCARRVEIEGAGHLAPLTHCDEVNDRIVSQLRDYAINPL